MECEWEGGWEELLRERDWRRSHCFGLEFQHRDPTHLKFVSLSAMEEEAKPSLNWFQCLKRLVSDKTVDTNQ